MAVIAGIALLRAGIAKSRQSQARSARSGASSGAATAMRSGFRSFEAPRLLHRHDFPQPESPWLLAVFTGRNCQTCAEVLQQLQQLQPQLPQTAAADTSHKKLLKRYGIEAVPVTALADSTGKVRWCRLGRLSESDLHELLTLASSPATQLPPLGVAGPTAASG